MQVQACAEGAVCSTAGVVVVVAEVSHRDRVRQGRLRTASYPSIPYWIQKPGSVGLRGTKDKPEKRVVVGAARVGRGNIDKTSQGPGSAELAADCRGWVGREGARRWCESEVDQVVKLKGENRAGCGSATGT